MLPTSLLSDISTASATPEATRTFLERLIEARPELAAELEADAVLASRLVAVVDASRSLARLLLTDPEALAVLRSVDEPVDVSASSDAATLVRNKRHELLRIAARDVSGLECVDGVGDSLAALADGVLRASTRLADADGLAVIAMGKHGARELNYSSDIDVMFVGSDSAADAAAARRLMEIARGCFRVDAALRPEGRNGPLVRSLDSFSAYWDRWARPWEFQALIKARFVAGDPTIGTTFDRAASERVWGTRLGAEELAELRSMKQRAEDELAKRGLTERELKRGRGGIRDIEFAVQLLQLVHGSGDESLRATSTLAALGALSANGYVDGADASRLALAYRFLRLAEHRLQLVEEAQVHTLPTDRTAREQLARTCGFADNKRLTALERFDEVLARHQAAVRSIHERLFFRPLLEAFTTGAGALGQEAVLERLSAFGFRDAARTREGVGELTRGLTRSSGLMRQMLPILLDWCSAAPDPDLALLGLRTLADGAHRRDAVTAAFRDSPEAARRLCLLAGTGRDLLDLLRRNPDVVRDLGRDSSLAARSARELDETAVLLADHDVERAGRSLRTLVGAEFARAAARDVLGLSHSGNPAGGTGRELAALARAVVGGALHAVSPSLPFAVVALGRLGGAELAYGSDLDLVLVYDGSGAADAAEAEESAAKLLRILNGATPSERVWHTDVSLRPEGKHGLLARSLPAYEEYYARWVEPWERQALLRARALAGDAEVADRFLALARAAALDHPVGEDMVRETRRMKARIERERIPPGADPQFHLKLGRGSLSDVEWTVQLLQLQHRVQAAGTVEALDALAAAGHLDRDDAEVLRESYGFCERTRNRWHLVGSFLATGGAGGAHAPAADALPGQPEPLARLSRSLSTTSSGLREDYRRVTRRARQVVERVFYGL